MKKIDTTPFVVALEQKQNELLLFVKQQTDNIDYPSQKELASLPISSNKTSPVPQYCIAGGAAALIIGLFAKSSIIPIAGGLAILGGIYLGAKQKNNVSAPQTPLINYDDLANRIYKNIEKTFSYVAEEWDSFLGKKKDELKLAIAASDLDNDNKQAMIERVMERTVIDFSMTKVLTELTKIAHEENVAAFKSYIQDFVRSFSEEIKKQGARQKEIYSLSLQE